MPSPIQFKRPSDLYEYMRWLPGREAAILAHRGAPPIGFAENTLAAYRRAWEASGCWTEVDVRTTRDGSLVLNHDRTLDRCTTGTGDLSERTLAELRSLRLKDEEHRVLDQTVETLDAVMDWAAGTTVVFLDIKEEGDAWGRVLRHVRERRQHTCCVVLTYAIVDTVRAHQLDPDVMVYGRATNEAHMRDLLSSGIPHERLVAWIHDETPPEVFERLHDEGILTTYGTFLEVDRRARQEGLGLYHERLAMGADILNSDDVEQAQEAIRTFTPAP